MARKNEADPKLRAFFEENVLKGTCFDTLEDLLNDKTLVQVNAPRALIACELSGVWRGLNLLHTTGAINALNEALSHQLANRGTEDEFYKCYTYNHGEQPKWVELAKKVLGEKSKRKVKYK